MGVEKEAGHTEPNIFFMPVIRNNHIYAICRIIKTASYLKIVVSRECVVAISNKYSIMSIPVALPMISQFENEVSNNTVQNDYAF